MRKGTSQLEGRRSRGQRSRRQRCFSGRRGRPDAKGLSDTRQTQGKQGPPKYLKPPRNKRSSGSRLPRPPTSRVLGWEPRRWLGNDTSNPFPKDKCHAKSRRRALPILDRKRRVGDTRVGSSSKMGRPRVPEKDHHVTPPTVRVKCPFL